LLLVGLCLGLTPLVGQDRPGKPPGKRYALLVGINVYEHPKLAALKFAENDAADLARVLRKAGYEVILLTGSAKGKSRRAEKANLEARLKEVLDRCKGGDTVVVALAGHGLQFRGKKDAYFCPSDAQPFATRTASLLSLNQVYRQMDESRASVKLLLVDACRDDPESSRGVDDSAPRPPRGVAALFSCSAGERAFETKKLGGGHGVFFHFVIEGLQGKAKDPKGAVTWHSLVGYVTEQVSEEVPEIIGGGARQTPHQMTDLKGKSPVLLTVPGGRTTVERPRTPVRPPKESEVKRRGKLGKEITNSIGMKLVLIPSGKFLRGSPADEEGRHDDEEQHTVEFSKSFHLGVTEVTQDQYRKVMGKNPSWFSASGEGKDQVARLATGNFPVEMVSWEDAVAFCKKLSALPAEMRAGRKYRLPTEAEWEFAARGVRGRNPFSFGKDLCSTQANFNGNFPYGAEERGPFLRRTCPVGSYKPDRRGLRDMHGNVAEWCADWYEEHYERTEPVKDPRGGASGTERVVRGGAWNAGAEECRCARRDKEKPGERSKCIGFRVACDVARR
jgi:formylglycine-generating enzyme required for sulfatase activity